MTLILISLIVKSLIFETKLTDTKHNYRNVRTSVQWYANTALSNISQ